MIASWLYNYIYIKIESVHWYMKLWLVYSIISWEN